MDARIPVAASDYALLADDIKVLCRHIVRLCLDTDFVVKNHEREVIIQGNVSGIACAFAWDLGAAIEAFAGRHAVDLFAFRTICEVGVVEHVMGATRANSPGSRGERLPSFDRVLGDKKLPRRVPLTCARRLDAGQCARDSDG